MTNPADGALQVAGLNPPARVFPPEVHASLAELRTIAKRAKSRHDPGLRWATEDEIALATTLRKPYHCAGHSSRTGLPCTKPRVIGMTVCRRHGGAITVVKDKAARRLLAMVAPSLGALLECVQQGDHQPTKLKAAQDVLDRIGIGALVEAKVRSSEREQHGSGITVHIGFLSPQPAAAVVVEHFPTGTAVRSLTPTERKPIVAD